MAQSIYVASAEGHTAKSVVALGVVEALAAKHKNIAVFRAIATTDKSKDPVLEMLHSVANSKLSITECFGTTYREMHQRPELAIEQVLERFKKIEEQSDAVVVLGSDYNDVFSPAEFQFNAKVAATLAIPMILVFNGREVFASSENIGQAAARSADELASMAEVIMQDVDLAHAEVIAAVVNRADEQAVEQIRTAVRTSLGGALDVWVIPEDKNLLAPTVAQVMQAVNGTLIYGRESELEVEVLDLIVAAMTAEHVLQRITEDAILVVPSDRTDVVLAMLMADASANFPKLAGIVLNGGFELSKPIAELISGLHPRVPVIETSGNSFDTTLKITATRGQISTADPAKVERARNLAKTHIDVEKLGSLVEQFKPTVITPLLFEYQLAQRASLASKVIVLPEGEDDRILQAAAQVLDNKIAKLIILGDPKSITERAATLNLDLSAAELVSIAQSPHFDSCVAEYVRLRAHKGVTVDQAREKMLDASYFGTMLVQLGIADGMVSGATHTTAHTITPAFEFIKTKPGVSVVSSVFLMALADRVLVYGDCAVIPEPTAEQLADIAVSSAATAANFGIEPRVAMLSYSTGNSGSGADVDKVRTATELVKQRAAHISVEGPIQYDAAVDAAVAKAKLPQSSVAGRATVFVFPDLNTGNNTYKAVQRTAGAVAIGPILQGLNKPVNDLSRGALVKDIVNTIAITAIQAEQL